jgi:hypothetical protein
MMDRRETWYDRLPTTSDLRVRGEYANWFQTMPWQLYATLTFTSERSSASADGALKGFLNDVERFYKASVPCVIGKEMARYSGLGEVAIRAHFHLLMASSVKLHAPEVEKLWWKYGGRGAGTKSALIVEYDHDFLLHNPDSTLTAAEYCTKFMTHPEWDWREHRLELLASSRPQSYATSARMRRKWNRARESQNTRLVESEQPHEALSLTLDL